RRRHPRRWCTRRKSLTFRGRSPATCWWPARCGPGERRCPPPLDANLRCGALVRDGVPVRQVAIEGFSALPSVAAVDPVLGLLAVGCAGGRVKVYGKEGV